MPLERSFRYGKLRFPERCQLKVEGGKSSGRNKNWRSNVHSPNDEEQRKGGGILISPSVSSLPWFHPLISITLLIHLAELANHLTFFSRNWLDWFNFSHYKGINSPRSFFFFRVAISISLVLEIAGKFIIISTSNYFNVDFERTDAWHHRRLADQYYGRRGIITLISASITIGITHRRHVVSLSHQIWRSRRTIFLLSACLLKKQG